MTSERNPDPGDPRDLLPKLRSRLAAERTWRGRLRALPTPARLLACLLALGITALAVGLLRRRSDLAAYPRLLVAASILLLAAFALLSLRMVLRPLHQRPPGPAATGLWLALGLGVPVFLALLPEAHALIHEHPESFEGQGADFGRRAVSCLLFGIAASLPLLALVRLVDRRERWSPARLALAAAAAGLAGNLVLLLHCPLVGRRHLIAGHATVGIAVLLVLGCATRVRARRRHATPSKKGM